MSQWIATTGVPGKATQLHVEHSTLRRAGGRMWTACGLSVSVADEQREQSRCIACERLAGLEAKR